MNILNKKIIYSFSAIMIFTLLFSVLNTAVSPGNKTLSTGWKATHDGITESISLPFQYDKKMNSYWTYETVFKDPQLVNPTLIITRPSAYAMDVKLNGSTIWKASDLNEPTANLWNSSFMIPVYDKLSEQNTLSISATQIHGTGFSVAPYFLEYKEAVKKTARINFLLNDLLVVSIGGSLTLGLLLILLSAGRKSRQGPAFFMGIASITAAIYCLDYHYRITGGSLTNFFIQKKIFLFCGYISAGSFLVAISRLTDSKVKFIKPVIILTIISSAGIAAAWNFQVLHLIFKFSNIILLLNLILGVYMIYQIASGRIPFLYPMWLLLLSIIQVIIDTIRNTSQPLTLQFILPVSIIFFSIYILMDINNIFRENKKLAIGVFKDPLTGVFNRHYLKQINPQQWNFVVMTDIDNFKYYNDTYGHPKGDEILKLFVYIVQKNLRAEDLILRYGGDEFLIFLSGVDTDQSKKILKRISDQFSEEVDDRKVGFSYGLKALNMDINGSIKTADSKMYAMKNTRKTYV